jgi:serine/threonine protein phosphatase PrpC
MRRALLRGGDHTRLGAVATVAEGCCALALSRGGAAKTYAHRDPNEDAAGFAAGESGALVAVADGHGGREASELAVDVLLARYAPAWTAAGGPAAPWPETARAAVLAVHQAIVAEAMGAAESARTTLAWALLRPAAGRLLWAATGDGHVFRTSGDEAVDLFVPRADPLYLGSPAHDAERLARATCAGDEPWAGSRAVVLATDGLSEPGIGVDWPEEAVREVVAAALGARAELRPLEVARGVAERALGAHAARRSGDNVAVAVLWPD